MLSDIEHTYLNTLNMVFDILWKNQLRDAHNTGSLKEVGTGDYPNLPEVDLILG
jgi:hypothetical protein